MSVKINQIEDFTKKCIINDIKLNTLGPCECKISVGGNIEPMYLKLKERIQLLQKKYEVVITKVDVYHDDDGYKGKNTGFSRVFIEYFVIDQLSEYLEIKRIKEETNVVSKEILKAFNKAIMIADDFNNYFGEGSFNKTKELNEIQKYFEILKDCNQ